MTEHQSPDDDHLQTEATSPSFSVTEVKADLSYFLKNDHALPAVTVKYLLDRFVAAAKREREDNTLGGLFAELSEEIRTKRGELSPGYLALADYVSKKVVVPAPRVSPVPPVTPAANDAHVISEVVASTSLGAGMAFTEEPASSVRTKMPLIMEMSLDEAIRAFFPSVSEVLLQAIRLKMIQGPSEDEAGTLDWQEHYFVDLVARFDSLRADLETLGISIESAARLLVGRGQQEANRAKSARASSSRRGELPTLVGVEVDKVQLAIAIERIQAGLPLEGEREVTPAGTGPENSVPNESLSIHERVTEVPPAPVTPATVDPSMRATITNETQQNSPARDALPTVPVDPREVRARLETIQHIPLAPADRPTEPPKAPKNRLVSSLRRLLGGDDKEKK